MANPRTPEAYEKLLKHYNKDVSEQITCECGKIVVKNMLKRHLESKTHQYLLYYKIKCSEMKKVEEKEIKRISTWNKVLTQS